MIAIDTNVLIRVLIDDPTAPNQCAAARSLIADQDKVRISVVAFVELMWVLARSYRFKRARIVAIAQTVLHHPALDVEQHDLLIEALALFDDSPIDFADALVMADARRSGALLHTFDRKLGRTAGACTVPA